MTKKTDAGLEVLLPILRPLSVVDLAVFGLPGDGVQLAPGLPSGLVEFPLLLFRKLLVMQDGTRCK